MADEKPPLAANEPPPSPDKVGIAPGLPSPAGLPPPPGAITAEPMAMPPIPLDPPKPAPPVTATLKDTEHKDTFRELIETVVFVVVLVLMLKTFLAEAFVIPTGSMADTLLGYHHKINCTQCGFPDLVNASDEADPPPQRGGPQAVVSCQCPNCGFTVELPHARRQVPRGGQP